MSRLTKRHFWDWFKHHQQEYRSLDKKSKKEIAYWQREMNAHLRAYHKFLGFSLTCPQEGEATLTITAHGKAIHFNSVEAFVATAPEIPGWRVRALETSMSVDSLLEQKMRKAGIDLGECRFSFSSDNPEALIVYHPLCTEENRRLLLQLAYSAVYNMLGERSFGTHIEYIGVENLSYADPDAVRPLKELPLYIGRLLSSMRVDENGRLQ